MNCASLLSLALVLPFSLAGTPAQAATYPGSFAVTMTVQPACTVSATGLSFGVYMGAPLDATATVTVTCTNTTPWYVNVGDGLNYDGEFYPRANGPSGALLSYRLYQDAARTVEWRNTYNRDGQSGTGSGVAQPLTVYGRVLIGQYVAPGSYSDTVVVTVTY